MWIAYSIPKIEDGNNFGVSIQGKIYILMKVERPINHFNALKVLVVFKINVKMLMWVRVFNIRN